MQHLNSVDPARSSVGISPNLQWEIQLPTGDRPDILVYDRTSIASVLQVIEVKGRWNQDYGLVEFQLHGYLDQLAKLTGKTLSQGTNLAGYTDSYRMVAKSCPGTAAIRYADYNVESGGPGLLVITRVLPPCNGSAQAVVPRSDPNEQSEDLPIFVEYVPSAVPRTDRYPTRSQYSLIKSAPTLPATGTTCSRMVCVTGRTGAFVLLRKATVYGRVIDSYFLAMDLLELVEELTGDGGGVYGDPHLVTLDGLHYDLQAVGEFTLAQSAGYGLEIQSRFVALGDNISRLDRTAFLLNGFRVEVTSDRQLLVDGVAKALAPGDQFFMGNGAALVRLPGTRPDYAAIWPGVDDRPVLRLDGTRMSLYVPPGQSDLKGLLGNGDGLPGNDLRLRDGTQLAANAGAAALHGSYAESWRVTASSSLFTYPAGKGTADYTNRAFPADVVSLADLSESDAVEATRRCQAAGVREGPPFDACVMDVALTATDEFAASAADIQGTVVTGDAATMSATGTVAWTFDGALPSNVRPTRLASHTATTRFAGPFGADETYGFWVAPVARHDSVRMSVDVLTVGNWDADADVEKLSVTVEGLARVDRTRAQLGTPIGSGTLANGVPFSRYRLVLDLPHFAERLAVQVSGTGINSLSSQGFGIDDVSLAARLVPAQTFTAALPLTAASGTVGMTAAAGAGNLETAASMDVYRFSVPAGGRQLQLSASNCPSTYYLDWALVSEASGATVKGGDCEFAELGLVPAGAYRLEVTPQHGRTGNYEMNVESAQTFRTAIPLAARSGTLNGVVAAGAGNLENAASKDVYRFSVPSGGSRLQLSPSACPGTYYLRWSLLAEATGALVKSGGCSMTDLGLLAAGDYRVEVLPEYRRSGTYGLDLLAPEVFAGTLPLSVASGTVNGVAVAGAGTLETAASKDVYRLTVPIGGQQLQLTHSSCPGT